MNNVSMIPQTMLEDLLLNQALTKREIARITTISFKHLNRLLKNRHTHLQSEQLQRLSKLYKRLKNFEKNIEDYLPKIATATKRD